MNLRGTAISFTNSTNTTPLSDLVLFPQRRPLFRIWYLTLVFCFFFDWAYTVLKLFRLSHWNPLVPIYTLVFLKSVWCSSSQPRSGADCTAVCYTNMPNIIHSPFANGFPHFCYDTAKRTFLCLSHLCRWTSFFRHYGLQTSPMTHSKELILYYNPKHTHKYEYVYHM